MFLIVREQGEIKNEESHIRMKFKMQPQPWEWVEVTHQGELEDIRGLAVDYLPSYEASARNK
jgi:hypothetical protein